MWAVFRNLAENYTTGGGTRRRTPRAIRRTIRVPTHRHAEVTQEISRLGQKLVSKPSASGPGNTGASPTQGRRAVYSNLLKTGKFACHRALISARSIAAVSS